jgi:hypothetical protein
VTILIVKQDIEGNNLAQFLFDPNPGLIFVLFHMGLDPSL